MLNPINHASSPARIARYRIAPNAAADAIAPVVWSAMLPAHLPARPPWTTGVMVSTIDSPQGPKSVEMPATIDATTTAIVTGPLNMPR